MVIYRYSIIGGGMTAAAAVEGNDRVRGVLLWNVWKQVQAARQRIAEPGPITVKNLEGRWPAKISSP